MAEGHEFLDLHVPLFWPATLNELRTAHETSIMIIISENELTTSWIRIKSSCSLLSLDYPGVEYPVRLAWLNIPEDANDKLNF